MWGLFETCLLVFRIQLKNVLLGYSMRNFIKERYFDFSKIFENENNLEDSKCFLKIIMWGEGIWGMKSKFVGNC